MVTMEKQDPKQEFRNLMYRRGMTDAAIRGVLNKYIGNESNEWSDAVANYQRHGGKGGEFDENILGCPLYWIHESDMTGGDQPRSLLNNSELVTKNRIISPFYDFYDIQEASGQELVPQGYSWVQQRDNVIIQ